VRFGVARPFKGVFDESGDIVFVFDDENAVSGHRRSQPSGQTFLRRIEVVNCELMVGSEEGQQTLALFVGARQKANGWLTRGLTAVVAYTAART
jgi:hypothetical protein